MPFIGCVVIIRTGNAIGGINSALGYSLQSAVVNNPLREPIGVDCGIQPEHAGRGALVRASPLEVRLLRLREFPCHATVRVDAYQASHFTMILGHEEFPMLAGGSSAGR